MHKQMSCHHHAYSGCQAAHLIAAASAPCAPTAGSVVSWGSGRLPACTIACVTMGRLLAR